MKTIRFTLLLLAVNLTAGAQNSDVEQAIRRLLASPGLTTSESIVRERDLSQPDNPMKSMCEVWEFTCDETMSGDIERLSAQMTACSSSPQCYYVKTHSPGHADWHDILVGDDPKRLVELGRSERSHYTIVNFLDTLDTTRSHRYAYALEWQEQNTPFKLKQQGGKLVKVPVTEKMLKGKVVITYARIPQAKAATDGLKEYNATVTHSLNGETIETLRKRLKEMDITDIENALKKLYEKTLEEADFWENQLDNLNELNE